MYKCFWVDREGGRNYEGTFEVIKETRGLLKLKLVEGGEVAIYPQRKTRTIPKKPGFISKYFYNAQFWEDSIQVHHDSSGYPFIYEPIK